MAKAYDVPADRLVAALAEELRGEGVEAPPWAAFVKTGAHAERPPQDPGWWHVRCASLLRKVYIHGPLGVRALRGLYGGCKPVGYGAARHRPAGGAIIRAAVRQLEGLGYLSKAPAGGRAISSSGMKKVDGAATRILREMASADKGLGVYA